MPTPTAEQVTQSPKLDHLAGVRSVFSAATACTPGMAARYIGPLRELLERLDLGRIDDVFDNASDHGPL